MWTRPDVTVPTTPTVFLGLIGITTTVHGNASVVLIRGTEPPHEPV
jgi:hypothetical protein